LSRLKPLNLITAVALLLFLPMTAAKLMLGKGKALFVNDGFHYYAYTVSIALDRDLDFTNQYRFRKGIGNQSVQGTVPLTGRPENPFAIGAGLIWLPVFFLVHLAILTLKVVGLPVTTTGFEIYYQLPVYFGSFLVGLSGIWLIYLLLNHINEDEKIIGWTIAALLFGTTISHYAFLHCNFAHWVSSAAIALYLLMVFHLSHQPEKPIQWLLAGLTLGLATLIRWQSVALVLLACGIVWQLLQNRKIWQLLTGVILYGIGTFFIFIPQLLAWHAIYGTWLTIPQGKDFMQWTSPQVLYVLFSLRHGLFTWSPILLLAMWGLLHRHPKVANSLRWSILLSLAAQIYINSVTKDFIGFGLRRMTDYYPLFAIGLLIAFETLQQHKKGYLVPILAVAAITFNWLIIAILYLGQLLRQGEFHFL